MKTSQPATISPISTPTTLFWKAAQTGDELTLVQLLEQSIDVNVQDEQDQTALILAGAGKHYQCMALLLEAGAKITPRFDCRYFKDALTWAISKDSSHYLSLFLAAGGNPNGQDSNGKTPLKVAAQQASPDCLKLLLAAGAKPKLGSDRGYDLLLSAVHKGNLACVQLLLDCGIRPNHTRKAAAFAFLNNLAATTTFSLAKAAASQGHSQVLRLLLASGAQPNPQDDLSYSPLMYATGPGHIDACHTLLIWGATTTPNEMARLRFAPKVAAEQRHQIIALLNSQQALRHQFSLLDYSDFMSDLYSNHLPEMALCQMLVRRDFNYHHRDYITPEGVHVIKASAILNKPTLLLTAAVLATDGDLLLSADIFTKQKQLLPVCHHTAINAAQTVLKQAQQLVTQYQPLAESSSMVDGAALPEELLQHQLLTRLLQPLKASALPLDDIVIDKIITRAAALCHQRRQVKVGCTTAFTELAATHPLLLSEIANLDTKLAQQADLVGAYQAAIFNNQPLSSLPAYVLWQHALSETNPKQKLSILFELLRQTESPWLKTALPIVLNHLMQSLPSSMTPTEARWLSIQIELLNQTAPSIANAITLLTLPKKPVAVEHSATTEHPNRFFVVTERTEEAQSASSEHDAASQPIP